MRLQTSSNPSGAAVHAPDSSASSFVAAEPPETGGDAGSKERLERASDGNAGANISNASASSSSSKDEISSAVLLETLLGDSWEAVTPGLDARPVNASESRARLTAAVLARGSRRASLVEAKKQTVAAKLPPKKAQGGAGMAHHGYRPFGGRLLLVVAACVYDEECGRVLIAQRPANKRWAGHWEFPGGKLEANETPEEGTAREIQEELGLKVDVAGMTEATFVSKKMSRQRHLVMFLMLCRRYSGLAVNLDGQAFAWATMDDLRKGVYLMTDADEAFVHWILRNIGAEADTARAAAAAAGRDEPPSVSDPKFMCAEPSRLGSAPDQKAH